MVNARQERGASIAIDTIVISQAILEKIAAKSGSKAVIRAQAFGP